MYRGSIATSISKIFLNIKKNIETILKQEQKGRFRIQKALT